MSALAGTVTLAATRAAVWEGVPATLALAGAGRVSVATTWGWLEAESLPPARGSVVTVAGNSSVHLHAPAAAALPPAARDTLAAALLRLGDEPGAAEWAELTRLYSAADGAALRRAADAFARPVTSGAADDGIEPHAAVLAWAEGGAVLGVVDLPFRAWVRPWLAAWIGEAASASLAGEIAAAARLQSGGALLGWVDRRVRGYAAGFRGECGAYVAREVSLRALREARTTVAAEPIASDTLVALDTASSVLAEAGQGMLAALAQLHAWRGAA